MSVEGADRQPAAVSPMLPAAAEGNDFIRYHNDVFQCVRDRIALTDLRIHRLYRVEPRISIRSGREGAMHEQKP